MRRYHIEHKDGIIQMVYDIHQEYNSAIYFLGTDRDLLDIDKHYIYMNGEFWIETAPENNSKIIGSIAVQKDVDNPFAVWLKRFYLLPEYRGSGLAKKMHNTVMEWCRLNKINKINLWCDTKFSLAHSFYKRNGYEKIGTRSINDGVTSSQESYFMKML